MSERRCPTCDRLVYDQYEHADYECENWPEWNIGTREVSYREFEITRNVHAGFQYVHEGYDGPEDNRAGTERNLVDCYRAIDDWHEEQS